MLFTSKKNIALLCALLAVSFQREALSQESCQTRELVTVELDANEGIETMKINGNSPRKGASFDAFFRNCAKSTVIIATDKTKLSQISDVLLYMGKIGIKPAKENTFIFLTSKNASSMMYLGSFATIKYTNNKSELMQIIKSPPMQSNWL